MTASSPPRRRAWPALLVTATVLLGLGAIALGARTAPTSAALPPRRPVPSSSAVTRPPRPRFNGSGANAVLHAAGAGHDPAAGETHATLASSTGADAAPVPDGWTSTTVTIDSGGMSRSYDLVRPPAGTDRLPVLVVLHGRAMTTDLMEEVSGFTGVVGRAILVYPAGFDESWNAGACCAGAHAANVDDVSFVTAVVKQVLAGQPDADPKAVYLAGFSNGGRMAFRLACAAPHVFAAAAAVEAVPVAPCPKAPPIPLLTIATSDDPLLSIDWRQPRKTIEGYLQPRVSDALATWRRLDGCRSTSTSATRNTVRTTLWARCKAGSKVELALYPSGGHVWPGTAGGPPAEQLIWSFFRGGARRSS